MLKQLVELFPELDPGDIREAVDIADGKLQELLGLFMTLAAEAGLDEAEVTDRFEQIECPSDWDASQ